MVGTNPYLVVALRRRSGRCTDSPCSLLPLPCAVCMCVLLRPASVLQRRQGVRAAATADASALCVRASVLLCARVRAAA